MQFEMMDSENRHQKRGDASWSVGSLTRFAVSFVCVKEDLREDQ
jgi:hypothetical protein